MTIDEAKDVLLREGYSGVNEWHGGHSVFYPDHERDGDISHIIVNGSMFISMNGEEVEYTPGDRCDVAAGTTHSVRMGEEGCRYIFGEKV